MHVPPVQFSVLLPLLVSVPPLLVTP